MSRRPISLGPFCESVSQCVCLRVASDLHCFPEDKTLHVTLYLAKKVRPVYSNALLADPTATNITFDTPIPLTGVFRVVS